MAEKNLKWGLFITFEGPEGCGKSTHSGLIAEYLKSKGYEVVYTREPGGTKIGEQIRRVLLDSKNKNMSALSEAFLYLAARAQVVKEVIQPALKRDKIVVCDRFQDATAVYQGYAGGLRAGMLKRLGDTATLGIKPRLTILLDIDTETGLKRAGCKDRMEKKSIAFHRKVRQGYLILARKEPKRVKLVNVAGTIEETQDEIRKIALKFIARHFKK